MQRIFLSLLVVLVSTAASLAQGSAPIDVLYRALGLRDVVAIMREEGIRYGADLDEELFGGRGGARWEGIVEQLYDVESMQATARNRLDAELAAADLAPMIGFFTSEKGRRIVRLEVSARRAMLDRSVDQASRARLDEMILAHAPRLDLIREFADAGDLIESNVVGAMNSNYAFYSALAEGGGLAGARTEREILADLWGQEEAIRDDTREWLFAYLVMAYQPLSDAELQDYTAFYETAPGSAINRALFVAFDEMFVDISRALGRAASDLLTGEDL